MAYLANLIKRESVINVRHRKIWNAPPFRTHYELEYIDYYLPTLVNSTCANRNDSHCITKNTVLTFCIFQISRFFFCVKFIEMISIDLIAICIKYAELFCVIVFRNF